MSDADIIVSVESQDWHRALPDIETWVADLARRTLEAACPGIGPAGISLLMRASELLDRPLRIARGGLREGVILDLLG